MGCADFNFFGSGLSGLGRNYLKGEVGDAMHAILCGAGHNIRMILRRLRIFWPHFWQSLSRLWGAFSSEQILSFA
jgi:IS5 family transposase